MASPKTPPADDLITALLSEDVTEDERARLFADLVARPITAELLAGGVQAMRHHMVPVALSADAIDTCGTGGSGKKTINTSTMTALIVAACGGTVAKHGNRSASGNCGCFDLLEELDVQINLSPEQEQRIFAELGIAFLFAPLHHPAMRLVAPLRKAHGQKTIFNLLGPLSNPAGAVRQLIGCGNDAQAQMIAEALRQLGQDGSMVVTGKDGLDEVSVCSPTVVRTVSAAGIAEDVFSPEDLGLPLQTDADIEGGTPAENAAVFREILAGDGGEAQRAVVLVNAAHALLVARRLDSLAEAYGLAKEALDTGLVQRLFEQYRVSSHTV